ncbi:hypothetical protein DM01DRAFT_1333972 [Hesseltinella vesiculosa]|uniref:Uncharacterized protein n=1 Tax=Hesseltinella vesiculosa TaxID=101127 RepID=A0A1X2GPH6_9FUNG|nr:hypothetical protein DM01DRAFT_1333972 [Hesseltinella vesiculosa]
MLISKRPRSVMDSCHRQAIDIRVVDTSAPCDLPETSPNTTRLPQQHYAFWDDSQLDIDLAEPHNQGLHKHRHRFKDKFLHPMRQSSSSQQQSERMSWISSSSTRSSLSSNRSLTYGPSSPSTFSYSKLSRPFVHLKHFIIKKHT